LVPKFNNLQKHAMKRKCKKIKLILQLANISCLQSHNMPKNKQFFSTWGRHTMTHLLIGGIWWVRKNKKMCNINHFFNYVNKKTFVGPKVCNIIFFFLMYEWKKTFVATCRFASVYYQLFSSIMWIFKITYGPTIVYYYFFFSLLWLESHLQTHKCAIIIFS
jgi:hypothetical protein